MEYTRRGASFNEDRTHRMCLWRAWGEGMSRCTPAGWKRSVMFIGLNPSKADERTDDMTIKKCVGFASQWGYQGIYMFNLYTHITTYPSELLTVSLPVRNPNNDNLLSYYGKRVGLAVACWGGVSKQLREKLEWEKRIEEVRQVIELPLHCLGVTSDGFPRHPSRLAYATPLATY
jgi:hypothetical protein